MENYFRLSDKFNPNYVAEFVKIDNVRKHPEADALDLVTIYGNDIVVAKNSVKIGDTMIYCPVESVLSKDFLSALNQFRDKELNANKESKGGFFEHHGRVKAVRLRGIPSTGFLFPITWFNEFVQDNSVDFNCENGQKFDTFNNQLIIKKYLPKRSNANLDGGSGKSKYQRRLRLFDKLVENQFHFHKDTEQMARNMHVLYPNTIIQISKKYHGTSAIFSHILVNKKLSWVEKLLSFFGVNIVNKEYDYIYSSRKVIKNRYINPFVKDYYSTDVWGQAMEVVKPFLTKGLSIYAEVVGYEKDTAKFIQDGHDYGCAEGEFKIKIYRITQTSEDGTVYEFTARQVEEWCKLKGLEAVKELYYGRADDVFLQQNCGTYSELENEENEEFLRQWRSEWLENMQKNKDLYFMELDDPECQNAVPFEGLVIRLDKLGIESYKLKTKKHLLWASKKQDEGALDMEEQEEEAD